MLQEIDCLQEALDSLGYKHDTISPEPSLPDFLKRIVKNSKVDAVFNLVEGYRGNSWGEPWIASFYEAFSVPYTGSPPATLSLCLDKRRTRAVLHHAGYPVPPAVVIQDLNLDGNLDSIEYPVILKPACRDASEGLTAACVVNGFDQLNAQAERLATEGLLPLLAEKFIEGREFSTALIQRQDWEVVAVFEVDFSGLPPDHPAVLCFEAKWKTDSVAYQGTTTNPLDDDPEIEACLKELGINVAREVGLRDYARIDFRTAPDGQHYIIDVNPNPDISSSSGFFRALASAQIEFPAFVQQMIENAQRRTVGV